jgi:NADH-quinone oxidoreductase subunit H
MSDLLRRLLGSFMSDWQITLIASVVTITLILLGAAFTMMMQVWMERRVVARMQDRLGPNRVGPAGLLQSIADGVKMFTKEDIVPRAADQWIHLLAPVVAAGPVMLMLAVVPWGRGMAPTAFGSGALFVLAVSSISAVGLMMAGWGSSNKFALLGAMRAVAQLISYEIPAVLAILSAVLVMGTMELSRMVELQGGIPFVGRSLLCSTPDSCSPLLYSTLDNNAALDLGLGWFVFTPVGLVGFVVFFICALAEGERTPFDIPEADSEIVAGHTTEYSGMKFALFYIGQYVLNFVLAMVSSLVFLGGWQGPGVAALATIPGSGDFWAGALSLFYLLLKAWVLFFVMIWLRGALPRLRVDQLISLAWKFLLPLALINLLSAALWVMIRLWGTAPEWTATISIPFTSISLLGRLETAAPWARDLVAILVTGLINWAAFTWLLDLNREAELEQPEAAIEPAVA